MRISLVQMRWNCLREVSPVQSAEKVGMDGSIVYTNVVDGKPGGGDNPCPLFVVHWNVPRFVVI